MEQKINNKKENINEQLTDFESNIFEIKCNECDNDTEQFIEKNEFENPIINKQEYNIIDYDKIHIELKNKKHSVKLQINKNEKQIENTKFALKNILDENNKLEEQNKQINLEIMNSNLRKQEIIEKNFEILELIKKQNSKNKIYENKANYF